jgi:deferrochelatase/peroxidase EfeB
MSTISRRGLLGAGAATAGAAVAVAGAAAVGGLPAAGVGGSGRRAKDVVEFTGAHQAGISTPVQDRMHTVAFDLNTSDRAAVIRLFKAWTDAATRMTAGLPVGEGAIPGVAEAPPDDTGEALGLPATRLTVTLGLGPGFFETADGKGADRLGLRSRRPAGLIDLPRFAGDKLEPARTGGDLVIQACADDPQIAVHAVRNLVRIAFGTASVRWSQLGFGKTSSTTPSEQTPRNLFGFKDGTNNIASDDDDLLTRHVWVDAARDGEPAWMHGGTFMVARRIAMRIETWDRTSLTEQQTLIGRTKGEGAPLGTARERDPVKIKTLPADSHVALAHPDANGGHRLLRRGYSFVDGSDGLGRLDAGLFFIAFCRDPRVQYVPMQARLASSDALMEYLVHTGSGLWAVPPGIGEGEYWAQSLLEG